MNRRKACGVNFEVHTQKFKRKFSQILSKDLRSMGLDFSLKAKTCEIEPNTKYILCIVYYCIVYITLCNILYTSGSSRFTSFVKIQESALKTHILDNGQAHCFKTLEITRGSPLLPQIDEVSFDSPGQKITKASTTHHHQAVKCQRFPQVVQRQTTGWFLWNFWDHLGCDPGTIMMLMRWFGPIVAPCPKTNAWILMQSTLNSLQR